MIKKTVQKGFTLIELLIVIALIGVLAVALLSTINPLEQTRKAQDSSRKAAAAELLNSIERFHSTFFCYPWEYDFTNQECLTAAVAGWTNGGTIADNTAVLEDALVTQSQEMKKEFFTRDVVESTGDNAITIYEDAGTNLVYICFKPESETFTAQATQDATGQPIDPGTHICVPE